LLIVDSSLPSEPSNIDPWVAPPFRIPGGLLNYYKSEASFNHIPKTLIKNFYKKGGKYRLAPKPQ